MLSAFLRSWRSVTVAVPPTPMVLAPLEIGPGWPTPPIMCDKDKASVAADSMAPYTSAFKCVFTLERAEIRIGCDSRCEDVVLAASAWA